MEATSYEGLRIDSYIRQGSSRDGLKVVAPDEFDTILEFHIEGLEINLKQQNIHKNGDRIVPGFCFMVIEGKPLDKLRERFPKLYREGVFVEKNGVVYMSSRCLHQRVFGSMVDKACNTIIEKIKNLKRSGESINFNITRKMNPPAINIVIILSDDVHALFMKQGQPRSTDSLVKEIDVDVVPGLLLRYDNTTKYEGMLLNCPIHAVCKWAEQERGKALEFVDASLVWSVNTNGYEKHLLDVARQDRRKLYILTALRIVKTYFVRTKAIAKKAGHVPPQIVTVLKSYHLKQIALYLMFYLCHLHPTFRLHSAHRATLYFIDIISTALNAKRLPHFFYSNNNVQVMLPGYPRPDGRFLKYDLFRGISHEALNQAKHSLDNQLTPNLGITFDGSGGDHERGTVVSEFESATGGIDFF